jgi:quinol monooxygenase YgiN
MITLINVFVVDSMNQQELVDILSEITEISVRRAAGFIAATLHRSVDGTKVTMYAQWRSILDYQAMREDPAPRLSFEKALSIAKFEPGLYEAVRTFTPSGD